MNSLIALHEDLMHRRILVQGIVQGVGFRPFVFGLALSFNLTGYVGNDSDGVIIEVEGEQAAIEAFQQALWEQAPPLARIEAISGDKILYQGDPAFTIIPSQAGEVRRTLISSDVSLCEDCQRELLDPSDRRFGYPFTNCTNCGPRFTIIQDIPYDRDKTTMRVFRMCPACQAEYDDPLNRRFHAQPNACPVCGPQVRLETSPESVGGEAAMLEAQRLLAQGRILAIKGLGGYYLACDALNSAAVSHLRQRKRREAKPFALMVPDLETARQLCFVEAAEAELLESRRRPVLLLRKRPDCPVAPGVAGGYSSLGLMLPYTPLHVLLLRGFAHESGSGRPAVLVMTSGNLSDEPDPGRDLGEARLIGHRFFFSQDEVTPFGVELARRLDERAWPAGVRIVDFGIRSFDLAFALVDGCQVAILLDAIQRGEAPGTFYVIEPSPEELDGLAPAHLEGHGLHPARVLQLAALYGRLPERILVVGCEPATTGFAAEDQMGLSEAVLASLDEATRLVESLVQTLQKEPAKTEEI